MVELLFAFFAERGFDGLRGPDVKPSPGIEDQPRVLGRVVVVGDGRAFAGDANDGARRMIGIGFNVGHVLAQLRLDEDWKRLDRLLLGLNQVGRMAKDEVVLAEDEVSSGLRGRLGGL